MPREADRSKEDESLHAPLDERVVSLMSSFPGAITFAGLRRTLGTHPESLTRSLRRLERDGTLVRTEEGYRLAQQTVEPLDGSLARSWFPARSDELALEVRLASGSDAAIILGSLAGRWFGEYRWVGSFEEEGGTLLVWTSSQSKRSLSLEVRGDRLRIFLRGLKGERTDDRSHPAYELLQHVTSALRAPPRAGLGSVLHLSAAEPPGAALRNFAG